MRSIFIIPRDDISDQRIRAAAAGNFPARRLPWSMARRRREVEVVDAKFRAVRDIIDYTMYCYILQQANI